MIRAAHVLTLAVAATTLGAGTLAASTSSLGCKHAKSASVKEICASPDLVAMDREISALYDRGLAQALREDRGRLVSSQKRFLRLRAGCDWASHHSAHPGTAIGECVRTSMEDRVHALRGLVDRTAR